MHVWDKNEKIKKAYDLLKKYGILLNKKHHRRHKSLVLKRIKEFAKEISDI